MFARIVIITETIYVIFYHSINYHNKRKENVKIIVTKKVYDQSVQYSLSTDHITFEMLLQELSACNWKKTMPQLCSTKSSLKSEVKSKLVGLFISKPLATVTLCIYILPGLLCQDKPLKMAKLILSIQCMLREQNKNYPLHDCKIYDLQVGNNYNIRMILHVNKLIYQAMKQKQFSTVYF
jgi:hypothetical protein